MQWMTFTQIHVKWSVILVDRSRPDILSMLEIKGQIYHRLNEITGDIENICLVSISLPRISKLLRMTFLTASLQEHRCFLALSAINAELGFVVHGKPDSLTLSLHQHLIWNYFWHRTAVNTYHTISVFPIISALTSLSPRSTWSTAANRCCSNTALSGRRSIAAAVTAE